jgi:hypothetical protein
MWLKDAPSGSFEMGFNGELWTEEDPMFKKNLPSVISTLRLGFA